MLNNRFYDGKVVYHPGRSDEEIRDGVHEVPDEIQRLWRQCQQIKKERSEPGRYSPPVREPRVYPLTGPLVCDYCGKPFRGVTSNGRNRRYPRMAHSMHRCGDGPLSVGAPGVEKEFADRVLGCVALTDDRRSSVLRALPREGPQPDHALEIKRIEVALANPEKASFVESHWRRCI